MLPLPRDPHARFLPQALIWAVVLQGLVSIAVAIAAPHWPVTFSAAIEAQLPGLTAAFAHTPRVEALLADGDERGYAPETREARRLAYGVSHLVIALSLVATLAGFGILLLRGIRAESYSVRVSGLVRTGADPVMHLVIAGVPLVLAAGAAALLYFGFLANAQNLKRDMLVPLVMFIDLMLLCALAQLAGLLHRALLRPSA
ncbi:hypothetical protein [Dongia sp.]|uniref:hypothetical protein n=1 Tax=Dongia sp. TaxID=1977262 RepID=UPI00375156A7